MTKNFKYGRRYALLITLGCNFGLRASDLVELKFKDLLSPHLLVFEQKTGKTRRIFINGKARFEIDNYIRDFDPAPDEFVFASQKGGALQAKALHKIIKSACRAVGLEGNFGSHSLRKTFAYHAYKLTKDVYAVRDCMNHSSVDVTKLYAADSNLGFFQFDCNSDFQGSHDEIYSALNL
jgi:integrase